MLLIDAGNTQLKWGLKSEGSASVQGSVDHQASLSRALEQIKEAAGDVASITIASVRSDAFNQQLKETAAQLWQCPLVFACSQKSQAGVTNIYQEPQRLGVDRWLAMLAAKQQNPKSPVLIIDAGTALTIDLVDQAGRHQGGYILPGNRLMIESILGRTAKVRYSDDEIKDPKLNWGTGTAEAVIHGAAFAAVATIEKSIQVARRQYPGLECFLTGGDGDWLAGDLSETISLDPDLVIKGLSIYAENPPSTAGS